MYKYIKRSLDLITALFLVIILSPIMLIAAILIAVNRDGPILFKQERPGKDGKIFTVNKFRTMSTKLRDKNGNELSDFDRMTKIGNILRKTSIDELPQLFNIIKGEMSFIGPRPLLKEYLELYSPEQMRRHEVLPGISGWAQVNGLRGDTSIEERINYDLYYIENWTVGFDIKIMFLTVFKGLINKNAY